MEAGMSLLRSINRDIQAALERDPAARSRLQVILTYPGFHARQLHRLAHALHQAGVPLLPAIVAFLNRFLTGIEIHPGAQIGEGLFIDHGMGVVIGETAVIGDNCHLTQGVTLGGTSNLREKRHPTLGNNVVVGAGAKIIGNITVGDHATIGAGSVVVSNVPAYATVVGVPGKVIAYYDPGNETKMRLPDPEWDRIEELSRQLEALREQVAALEAELAAHGRAAIEAAHSLRAGDN
ncbi:MAG TPA: serine O-acetyltransferase [Dehalococcoidia bacterium]|nr:serine O-acetyltransferase [Dehalococcoidia bacterium]